MLVEDVRANAVSAAFHDPRFPPMQADELDIIRVEVSVLSVPAPLSYDGPDDLIAKLRPGVDGVVVESGWNRATFLPQVWKQLPDKEQFLEHLCQKGGMSKRAWQDPETKVQVYRAEVFGENDFK